MSQLFVAAPEHNGGRPSGIDLDRPGLPAAQARRNGDVYFSVAVQPDHGLQGHVDDHAAAPILSGPARRTVHECHRDRAQPLFHQHLPVLAAGLPFRFVAHNGEINTVRGNRNRMHAREAMLASTRIGGDLSRLSPICTPDASDSASFDEVLELLHLGGRACRTPC